MIYSDIEDLLFCEEAQEHLYEGLRYTAPFFAIIDGTVADVFLFYSVDGEDAWCYRFLAVDPKNKKVVKVESDLEILLEELFSDKADYGEYKQIYEELHGFIFEKELTQEQKNVAKKYLFFVEQKNYQYVKAVYTELFPEVLEWLREQTK